METWICSQRAASVFALTATGRTPSTHVQALCDRNGLGSPTQLWGKISAFRSAATSKHGKQLADNLDILREYTNGGAHWGRDANIEDAAAVACRYTVAVLLQVRACDCMLRHVPHVPHLFMCAPPCTQFKAMHPRSSGAGSSGAGSSGSNQVSILPCLTHCPWGSHGTQELLLWRAGAFHWLPLCHSATPWGWHVLRLPRGSPRHPRPSSPCTRETGAAESICHWQKDARALLGGVCSGGGERPGGRRQHEHDGEFFAVRQQGRGRSAPH